MKPYKRFGCILLSSVLLGGTLAETLPQTAWAVEANVPTIQLEAEQPVYYTMKVSARVQLAAKELASPAGGGQQKPDAGSGKQPEENTNKWVYVTRWSSEDESVATVTQDGLVTAVGAGETKIYGAYEDGRIVTCVLTVTNDAAVETMTLTPQKNSMYVGDLQQISLKITPEEAADNTKITWWSSDPSVLTVSGSGQVTAVAAGEAVVTAVAKNGIRAFCTIKVVDYAITGISLNMKTLNLAIGGQAALLATVSPSQAKPQIAWSTSNNAVAIVNASGKVTAVNAGTATITASAGGIHASCVVTVRSNVASSSSNGFVSTSPSTFTGFTGINSTTGQIGTTAGSSATKGSIYIPGTTPNAADIREYTMPEHIPTLAFLTVDSDLGSNTSAILAQLGMYGVSATFFVPIDDLYSADNLLREIVGEGHNVGFLLQQDQLTDAAQAVALLDKANKQLSVITGTPTRLIRAAGGSSAAGVTSETLNTLQTGGYSLWDWNSAPESYQTAVTALNQTDAVTLRFDSNAADTLQTLQQLLPYVQYCGIPAKPLSAGDTPVCQIS